MKLDICKIALILILSLFLSACATLSKHMGGPKPNDSAEFEIISQAKNTGTAIGAAAGAVAGAVIAKQVIDNPLLGGVIGGAVGAIGGRLIGEHIGKKQLYAYRDIRLKNNQLKALLQEARKYNKEVHQFNVALQKDIRNLKKKSIPERKRICELKKNEAKGYLEAIQSKIEERKKLTETLVKNQKGTYKKELTTLEKEEKSLNKKIAVLEDITKNPAMIG